jgi:hypothetical protein
MASSDSAVPRDSGAKEAHVVAELIVTHEELLVTTCSLIPAPVAAHTSMHLVAYSFTV